MCGISGIIYKNSDNIKDQIKNISNAISSRGPDGTNIFINENIALSHNRLAILDRNKVQSNAESPPPAINTILSLYLSGSFTK